MKLVVRQYLSSLRERGELDAVLPDLLSEMGLTVFSRPRRGTRQDGVDVGAVGSLNGDPERVFLFTIKSGDLTRSDWDGTTPQSVRPSLNEMIDSYIPGRLPSEHRNKPITICIAIGGDVSEQVRPPLRGFIDRHQSDALRFEEWNGDVIAGHIEQHLLREDLLPAGSRALLRKALALIDEPDASHRHFAQLLESLAPSGESNDADAVRRVRQIGLCLWILFAWARDADNLEAAYRGGESSLLRVWTSFVRYRERDGERASEIRESFLAVLSAYHLISREFLLHNVVPHADKRHLLSSAVRGGSAVDVNLILFDLIGRLGVASLWSHWGAAQCEPAEVELQESLIAEAREYRGAIKAAISNNPTLFLPIRDEQVIEIGIAVLALALDPQSVSDVALWLSEMMERAAFAYEAHAAYPCTLSGYVELLEHPRPRDEEYRKAVTAGSVLYPTVSLWAALFPDSDLFAKAARMKSLLSHANFQLWYPDNSSEALIYTSREQHGVALSNVPVQASPEELLDQVFGECDRLPACRELSAYRFGMWPLIVLACRHNRFPIPPHLLAGFRARAADSAAQTDPAAGAA